VTETTPEHNDPRQGLIDELQSLSATLGGAGHGARAHGDIPVLQDVVELPQATASPARAPAALQAGIDLGAAMQVEAGFILDDLMDEFLPLVEARLRERLEERMRQLLAPGPDSAPVE
jgi:hypothetical protein